MVNNLKELQPRFNPHLTKSATIFSSLIKKYKRLNEIYLSVGEIQTTKPKINRRPPPLFSIQIMRVIIL